MSDDLRRDLEAAGRRPVPEPRPGFEAALEERLLAIARTPVAALPPTPPPARAVVRRRLAFGFAGGLAGAAALVAIALLVTTLGGRPLPSLELTGAVNVEVALADGTTLLDPDGLLLPDGSEVRVGAGGSARIGDVVLAAGDVATVADGRLQVRPPGSEASRPGSPAPTSGRPTASAPAATRAPTPTPVAASPTPSPAPSPTSGSPTKAPPSVKPDATRSPAPTPAGTPPSATATPVPATPTPSVVDPIKLLARATGPAEVKVTWTGADGARRYRLFAWVWRAGDGTEPVRSARKLIGEFTRPPDSPLTFRVRADVVRVRLLVIAFAADGTELTRSNVARVSFGE
jgi:hypothetical protein